MSGRYMMLAATIPVCYFFGYVYREYTDPDFESTGASNRDPAKLSDSFITNRLQVLEEAKSKVHQQLAEVEAHKHKLKSESKGRNTDLPGRLW